uniref:Uncharacterized protein n=1 Tax=Anguilla anguilla TaxID=7936 RepID=A0A0E9TVF5_ANGAN
MIGARARTLIS